MVSARALVMALGLFAVSLAWIPGCRSGPAQALDGARYYLSGSEALERGDPERALVELLRAAELVPQASEIRNHLGIAYWETGDLLRARGSFETALELDCDNAAAEANLSLLVSAMETEQSEEMSRDDEASADGSSGLERRERNAR